MEISCDSLCQSGCFCLVSGLTECICVPLEEGILEELVSKAKDFALMHGAGLRHKNSFDPDILQMAPFYLFPSSFPKRDFDRAVTLQPVVNRLVHRIAHNYDFLEECLRRTILVDDFTAKLWNIYETVRKEGITQELSLGLLRSDVMLTSCEPGKCYLCLTPPYVTQHQVEFNTIASGFGHLGPISGKIHRYVLGELGRHDIIKNLPENPALEELCLGMIQAWEVYGKKKAVILFLIEDVTYNICDQRFHEFKIRSLRPDIFVIRKTLTEINKQGCLDEEKQLMINGNEVAVVYFRAGYEPAHYHSDAEWDARLMIERSKAIKSPSIYYHLAGTKKVQQELARPGALLKFLEPPEAKAVSELFTGLYSLDFDADGDEAVENAIKDPEKYVLKPQREGGGNNLYGQEIAKVLTVIKNSKEREAYILMDRIFPPVQKNYLIRAHELPFLADTVSELGIFGVIIGTKEEILHNRYAGHMLRTKLSSVNEGGVAAGLGALDSVYLCES